ncbi:MAG: hypothetical protein WC277_09090, partial [Bacilli bacterium]
MAPFTLSLNYDRPSALLEPDSDGRARRIYLVIDWQERMISAETQAHDDNTQTEYRWRGMEDAYPLPPLVDATQLREWVGKEVLPRATPLLEAYQTVWDDVERFGRFPGHEREKEEFDTWMSCEAEPPTHTGGLWRVAEWLPDIADEVFPDSTDERLQRVALQIEHEAEIDGVVFAEGGEAVLALLKVVRDEIQQQAPGTPDRYEIEGYEILERVPRAYSRQSSATLYLPLEW